MDVDALIGWNFKRLRLNLGLSQEELALRLGTIDQAYISQLEAGERNPTGRTIFRLAEALGVSTYPEDWTHYYMARDCMRFDPVVLSARGDVGPFFWSDLRHRFDLTPLQTNLMEMAVEGGLYNGIGLPFVGSRSRHGGVALATLTPTTEHCRNLELLWSISNLFYWRLSDLVNGPRPMALRPIDLTPRELDIINLSFRGQSDKEVAADLDITENTVNTHFRKIFRRLGVNNRVQAFVKAARHGIIDLPNPSG